MDLSTVSGVGFVGLGAMGLPMAGHLAMKLPKHITLHAFDVNQARMAELQQNHPARVIQCASAREVAEQSDIIMTMLPEGKHVRSVYMDGDADTTICSSEVAGKLLVDCSTIDTASNLAVKDHLSQHFPTASFYDAPVSGGVVGAQKGTIAFFLGCNEADPRLVHLTELLTLMGKDVLPCGGPSKGLVAKLSNNYLSGTVAIAVSEAMDMGMRSGLDPRVLARVFAAGTAQNAICDRFCPVPGVVAEAPSSHGYANGFKVELMRKDYALALDMVKRVGARNALGPAGLQTYDGACRDPTCQDLDSRVVFRYLGGNEHWQQLDDSVPSRLN